MRRYRKRICACAALILTVVIVIGAVWNGSGVSYAHETFTGVSNLVSDKISNNQEFLILEIVDDLEEASIGYLVGGQEPYANRLNSMTAQEHSALIAELQEKGLLAADDSAEQSAYPISFSTETKLSTDPSDQELSDAGFLIVMDDETGEPKARKVKGYFIAQNADATGYEGYYRLVNTDIENDALTYAEVLQLLLDSYTGTLYTTDADYTAYDFVADEEADVPDLIDHYNIKVHRFGPLTDENGQLIGYGYDNTESEENDLLEVHVTDDDGKIALSDIYVQSEYLAEDGTKYKFSHYALGDVNGETVTEDYVYTADTDIWAVYTEVPSGEHIVTAYYVEAVYDEAGTTIIEYRTLEGDQTVLVTTDSKITLPSANVYEGYTFIGKYLLSDMLTEVTADYEYDADTDIYIPYTRNTAETYTITIHYGSVVRDPNTGDIIDYEYAGSTVPAETDASGKITLPEASSVSALEGYRFKGFSATQKDTDALLSGSEVYTADGDIYAVYELDTDPDATVTPTPDPAASATPTPNPDATVTPTPDPAASATPTPNPDATATPTPDPAASATPTPSPTEAPSPTPDSGATPTPDSGSAAISIDIDTEHGELLASNGIYLPIVAASGSTLPKPSDMNRFAGYGYQFTYEKATLANNNLFKTHVLGLEEGSEKFNKLNIRVLTFTADGRALWTNTENLSLTEALEKADLVYISGDGRTSDGGRLSDSDDISAGAMQTIYGRAADTAEPMPVIVDYSVYTSDSIPKNLHRLACLLLQPNLSEVYPNVNFDNLESNDWEQWKNAVSIDNGGNFVRDNVFCVNYQRNCFKNSSYEANSAALTNGKMSALANADFERQYTDTVSDAGFGKVFQAIQQENYERGQKDSGQASMNEYVSPAVAVAYILNFKGYDPIIYKDTIRVLELEPCRSYTYYYDGDTSTEAGRAEQQRRKLAFATKWAPAFEEKLDNITIVGMTTSEFCGKISDVYEEYDVIYFGSNTDLMNMMTVGGGDVWNLSSLDYSGYVSLTNINLNGGYIDGNTRWEYENGVWYRSTSSGNQEVIEWSNWSEDFLSYTWYDTDDHRYYCPNANWRWNSSTNQWQERVSERNDQWQNDSQWVYTGRTYPYDIEIGEYWDDAAQKNKKMKYVAADGKWYSSTKSSQWQQVWSARQVVADGLPYTWYDGSDQWNPADSQWKWDKDSRRWYVKGKEATRTLTAYNDSNMYGMVYTHTGDWYNTWDAYYGLVPDEGSVGFRLSGNDILEDQVAELLEFLNSGSPIILASDFMTYNDDGTIKGVNSSDVTETIRVKHSWEDVYDEYVCHGILDTSSYVYQFVSKAYTQGYSNLLVDGKDTYNEMAAALNQQKLTLNMLSIPTEYTYTETNDALGSIVECTYLSKESDGKYYLNYEFMISNLSAITPLTTRYDIRLYLDSNSDGIYNEATEELADIVVTNAQTGETLTRVAGPISSEEGAESVLHYELSANTPYTVRRELPEGYVGCIGWKLKASQVGNIHIHDSVTGLTAVKNEAEDGAQIDPVTGKQVIHVLQIVSDGGGTLDLEEQTEGSFAGGEWDILLSSIPDFVIDFDSILESDFAYSFENEADGEYYDPRNDSGAGGYLTGQTVWNDELGDYARRRDYLNFYDYDMVIVGFADKYSNLPSQRATEALLAYGNSGKSLLYTHDTTFTSEGVLKEPAVSDFSGTGATSTLSMSIREQCGMDRYGVSVDWYGENSADNPIRSGGDTSTDAVLAYNGANDRTGSDIAYLPGTHQTVMAAQTQGFTFSGMAHNVNGYKNLNYGSIEGGLTQASWMYGQGADNHNRVTQVNSGIITQYPYTIGEEIVVSNTHAQYFQVDLDTDKDGDGRGDVVVWYCISSLDDSTPWTEDNGEVTFTPNDVYDYSPNDVRNNYYIYNKGNITYTGVGHDGNFTIDEMKLFINTFVAAYNAGVRNPSVRIVDGTSINAPDLEHVNIPFEDTQASDTYRVYFQVKDNNITIGTKKLSIRYCIGSAGSTDTISYQGDEIAVSWFGDGVLKTYQAITGEEVPYDQVVSGNTYYVDVPLNALVGPPESFNFYVEVDLKLEGTDEIAAYAIDKLIISELKLFDLD